MAFEAPQSVVRTHEGRLDYGKASGVRGPQSTSLQRAGLGGNLRQRLTLLGIAGSNDCKGLPIEGLTPLQAPLNDSPPEITSLSKPSCDSLALGPPFVLPDKTPSLAVDLSPSPLGSLLHAPASSLQESLPSQR